METNANHLVFREKNTGTFSWIPPQKINWLLFPDSKVLKSMPAEHRRLALAGAELLRTEILKSISIHLQGLGLGLVAAHRKQEALHSIILRLESENHALVRKLAKRTRVRKK